MKHPSLLQTTGVRLALHYTLIYALLMILAIAALYWSGSRYVGTGLEEELTQELGELSDSFERGALVQALGARQENAIDDGRYYLLVDAALKPVAGNLNKWPREADISFEGEVHNLWLDENLFPDTRFDDDAWLPAVARQFPDGSRLLLLRAVEQDNFLREVSDYLLESLAAVVITALVIGLLMGRAMRKRMDAISRTAGDIMAGDLSRRVPSGQRDDEFDALAQRLNGMLDRIEAVLASMREVTDNVAHDLRNPITRIRNRMEVILLEPRSEAEYRDVMEKTIRDADILIKTFNTILQTAQANAGALRADLESVELAKLVEEMGELYTPAAEEAGLNMQVEASTQASVAGNRDLLAQALGNLLDNAIKYTPSGGQVFLELRATNGYTDLIVEDTGPGIDRKDHDRVRQRFVRLDTVRQQEGNGLGLSLVDAIARQHGASLLFEDHEPGLRTIIRFS